MYERKYKKQNNLRKKITFYFFVYKYIFITIF